MLKEKMRFTLALVLWLLLTCPSGTAYALSCAQPKMDETVITNAVAVFEGVAGKKHSLTWKQAAAGVKKFLQIDYSAASNRAYADLIDLRSTGIFKNISLTRGQAHRDFFL